MMLEIDKIHRMDCLEGLRQMEAGTVDLIATDPPYGLNFMNLKFDKAVPPLEIWREGLRVLKPGGFAFVMCAPRADVQAEMIIRLRDAGFWVGFTPIYWAYASGFPKAMNISKAVDKRLGFETNNVPITSRKFEDITGGSFNRKDEKTKSTKTLYEHVPSSPEAKSLEGSFAGFQPKPAVEVILVAMKPLSEKTFVDQALKNGKGVTWLDDGRIPFVHNGDQAAAAAAAREHQQARCNEEKHQTVSLILNDSRIGKSPQDEFEKYMESVGRFPANLLVSDGVLDDGRVTTSRPSASHLMSSDCPTGNFLSGCREQGGSDISDTGSFSRYFSLDAWWAERIKKLPPEVRKTFPFLLVPKASTGEKNEGCEELDGTTTCGAYGNGIGMVPKVAGERPTAYKNFHPTVKPLQLMSYLVTLGSQEGDLVLDPFAGSGTTAVACRVLNRRFIGFEISEEYCKIAEARVGEAMAQRKLTEFVPL